ncbi:TetR/AcrR family transcriptional regulator [Actinomycetota bacterium]
MTLRERKRQRTKERIQDEAFALVRRDGFDATTIEAIAEAAEVSPSTVYRYFGTKEGVLLWDELEPPSWDVLHEELEQRPPLDALLVTFERVMQLGFHVPDEEMRARVRLIFELPQLRSAFRDALADYEREFAAVITERSDVGRLEARVIAVVAIGTFAAVIEDWAMSPDEQPFSAVADANLAALQAILNGSRS